MVTQIIQSAVENGTFRCAVFSRLLDKTVKKTVLTRIAMGDRQIYRAESFYTDGKARQVNLSDDRLRAYTEELLSGKCRQLDIVTTGGSCTVMVAKDGKRHISNKISLSGAPKCSAANPHDRKKKYILDDSSALPFLHFLGVCSDRGEVFDRRRAKYRQINRFLEIVSDIYPSLPENGDLTVCDLCCGKAYLTFAVYWYLTQVKHRTVCLYGVDRKEDVMELCRTGAEQLGFEGMKFIAGDITAFAPDTTPDLVVSLHACDIATDLVLSSAVKQGARVILSTPCCHKELMHQMNCPHPCTRCEAFHSQAENE